MKPKDDSGKKAFKLLTGIVPVFLLLCGQISCGPPAAKPVGKPELDTSLYSKYIAKGPDTNIYPVHQRTTSQRYPLEKYGLQQLFDGDRKTWWCSQPGLNYGEGVEFVFPGLEATQVRIYLAEDVTVTRVNGLRVYVNDSLYGTFPSGAPVVIKGRLNKLRVVAADAEGMNEVKLPVVNDTVGNHRVAYQILRTRYNSHSIGIAEIEITGANNRRLPVKAIPYRYATIQSAFIADQASRYNMFDGNEHTGTVYFEGGGKGKIIMIFDDFTPLTRMRMYTGVHDLEDFPFVNKMGVSIAGKKEFVFTLQPGENIVELEEPFVARSITLTFYDFERGWTVGTLAEWYGYDGARWYQVIPDSSAERLPALVDTLKRTPLHFVLDNRVYYSVRNLELVADTFRMENYEHISPNYLSRSEEDHFEALFRSNGSMEYRLYRVVDNYGKSPQRKVEEHQLTGRWRLVERSNERVKLDVVAWDQETITVDGKPVSAARNKHKLQAVIEKNTLDLGPGYPVMLITY